jgi:SPP1 family predicted phage head-tail adaptor
MIKTIKGREYYQAASVQAENEMRFVVRYSKSLEQVDNKYRIKYKGRYFDIQSIMNDDELNKTFTIIVKERM